MAFGRFLYYFLCVRLLGGCVPSLPMGVRGVPGMAKFDAIIIYTTSLKSLFCVFSRAARMLTIILGCCLKHDTVSTPVLHPDGRSKGSDGTLTSMLRMRQWPMATMGCICQVAVSVKSSTMVRLNRYSRMCVVTSRCWGGGYKEHP